MKKKKKKGNFRILGTNKTSLNTSSQMIGNIIGNIVYWMFWIGIIIFIFSIIVGWFFGALFSIILSLPILYFAEKDRNEGY